MEEKKIVAESGKSKKYLLPLLIFVVVLIAAGGLWWFFYSAGKKEAQAPKEIFPKKEVTSVENWSEYKNTKYNYGLKYPDNWFADILNTPESSMVDFSSAEIADQETEIKGVKLEVAVYQKDAKTTLEDWIAANQKLTQKTPENSEDIEVDDMPAKKLTYSSPIPLINILIPQEKNYIISLSYFGQKEEFEASQEIFGKILENFKLN